MWPHTDGNKEGFHGNIVLYVAQYIYSIYIYSCHSFVDKDEVIAATRKN